MLQTLFIFISWGAVKEICAIQWLLTDLSDTGFGFMT